jgi:hypothetical protein
MVKPYIMVERSFNLECVLKLDTWGHKPRASKVSMVGERRSGRRPWPVLCRGVWGLVGRTLGLRTGDRVT